VDQGRLVAVRWRKLRRCGSSFRRPAARHGRHCGFGLVGRPSQCNGKLEVGVAPGGRWAVAAMLDRGEGSRVAVPARTRATGAKQLLPRRGTCRTVRVARPRPLVSGRRLQYGMKPRMDCTGYGCLGCGTNVWCRHRKEAVAPGSRVAGRRGRTRVSVLQKRGGSTDAKYPVRTRAPAMRRLLWCRLRSSVGLCLLRRA
jgi:hypothetical protein